MIPQDVLNGIQKALTSIHGHATDISSHRSLGGGCINEAARIQVGNRSYFVKWNLARRYPNMFGAEAIGLKMLEDTGEIQVPGVVCAGEEGNYQFLLLEFIDRAVEVESFWQDFGASLARLHRNTHSSFGASHNNYIGSLPQSNAFTTSWVEFFVSQRLEPQIRMAVDSGSCDRMLMVHFQAFFNRIEEIFPDEPPALLHGDLWSGNFMTGSRGKACIFDPAVYYGHREMDIAMTTLFGGFANEFYNSYNNEYRMEAGWEKRLPFCNLYPLLVHVNLFGGGYLSQVNSILRQF
ncbi:MAG: fructosamine kinase family protein [Bacteroidetes bacterium]|nr:fructosamine kinase family protein [Bacteroidota bacterium]